MLIEQIVELQLRKPGPPGLTCTSISGYFQDKTKISKENLRVSFHLLLRCFTRQCTLLRPGATGGHFGAVPPQMTACAPQTKIVPPKRGLCPEEINRHGATGVQMEAKNSQISVYRCNFCGLTPSFLILLVLKTFFFFFFGLHLRIRGKSQEF